MVSITALSLSADDLSLGRPDFDILLPVCLCMLCIHVYIVEYGILNSLDNFNTFGALDNSILLNTVDLIASVYLLTVLIFISLAPNQIIFIRGDNFPDSGGESFKKSLMSSKKFP